MCKQSVQENRQNKLSFKNGQTYKNRTKINNKFKILKNIKNGPKWWICKQSVQTNHQHKLIHK